MSHLTRTTQKSIFETTVAGRKPAREESGAVAPYPVGIDREPPPFAVAVDQTPEQARCTRSANYPQYDWPSVRNIEPRKRGRHY